MPGSKIVVKASIKSAGYRDGFYLKNICFKLNEGDIIVIAGRSGSGKSTLLKVLLNIIQLFGGFSESIIKYYDKDLKEYNSEDLYRLISYIPQDPWYGIIGHTVWVEYCHALAIAGIRCDKKMLSKYGLLDIKDQITYGLSAGQYQKLLWASTLDKKTNIIMLDEPLVYMDSEGRKIAIKLVKDFIENNGVAIIVDHMPLEWKNLDPKLLVLEKGVQKYYGEYISNQIPPIKFKTKQYYESNYTILIGKNIWFKYPGEKYILNGINVEIHKGEVVGLIGKNGSGKSTLLKILSGIYKPKKGNIYKKGRIIYIPENPLLYYTYPNPREELLASNKDKKLVWKVIEEFNLINLLDRPLAFLSSGERRLVALASAFLAGYDIYLLDEPSGGLDNYTLEKIINIIEFLAENKKGILIASHDERIYTVFDKTCTLSRGVLSCK